MTQCQFCRSADIISNRFDNMPFAKVARGAIDAHQAGKTLHGAYALAVWVGIEVTNHLRAGCKCRTCGGVF